MILVYSESKNLTIELLHKATDLAKELKTKTIAIIIGKNDDSLAQEYIAYGADIPILMVYIDYQMKLITLSKPFWPSGNYKNDIVEIMDFYKDKKEKAIT